MAKDLTVAAVRNAKPDGKRIEIPDGKSRGLFLIVQPSGAKSWALRYRFNGKPRKLTIGPVLIDRETPIAALPLGEPHTLTEARTAADRARIDVAHGIDPTARAAKAEADKLTVRTAAIRFIDEYCKARNRSWREVERQFNANILPAIGDTPLIEVTGDDAREIVKRASADGSTTMANRLHATLAKFFKWCTDRDRKLITSNPYEGYDKPNAEKSRDRALSWTELAQLWHTASDAGQPFGLLLQLLILTGQRRSEVTGMTDAELDLPRALWTIPADRAKNGERHTVPLNKPALNTIKQVKRIGRHGLIFTTNGEAVFAGHHKAKARIDAELQWNEPWRLHDIRRTVATGMAELGEPVHVVEAILNHKSGTVSGIAAVYNVHTYAEEKEHAMTTWGRFVSEVIADDVVRHAYEQLSDRRRFRDAIHGPAPRWRRFLTLLRRWQRYVEHVQRKREVVAA